MIVKVPPARQDGGSSFEDLEAYITEGIDQSGEGTDRGSWEKLTQYITKESVLNALGENVEKTIAVEIGNVASLDTAAEEMKLVAAYNKRAKNPTLHYILSWPEGEVPKPNEIFDAVRSTLKSLGMADHQYIVAIHGNTDNIHAHIAVNRVHPITYKAARLEWLHKTLHKAAREIEIEHGWSHDNGLFKVVEIGGQKHVVPNTEYVDPDLAQVKGGAAAFETWHGEQSLETWCRGEPAKELKAVLAAKTTTGWQDIHRCLSQFGLELRDSGGGGMRVHTLQEPGADAGDVKEKNPSVSASKAFRFLKRADLEARFGKFQSPMQGGVPEVPKTTYKRDPGKRLERKLERRALRDALHKRFIEEQKVARIKHELARREIKETFSEDDQARRAAVKAKYSLQRAAIKSDPTLSRQAKQQAYMLAKLTMASASQQLQEQIAHERQDRKSLMPTLPTWREWVEEQALIGDEAAISALRGMVYQEKRQGKKVADEDRENAIRPAYPALTDPLIRKLHTLTWKVHRNGTVAYNFKSGENGFIDAGEKLVFGRVGVSDEALALTLQYAKDKWGGELKITGGDAAFKARVASMANDLRIALKNPDLKALQAQIRAEKASPVPPSIAVRPLCATPEVGRSVEESIRSLHPHADIQHAITQSTRYRGKIIAEDARFIAQSVGNEKFVLHDKDTMASNRPTVGESVTISYKSGSAVVKGRSGSSR